MTQGLRAFTPTDPTDLQKFAELRHALSSEAASVERITAISSEEENFLGGEKVRQLREKQRLQKLRQEEAEAEQQQQEVVPVSNPTRPPRPHKAARPSLSYLPPPGAPLPLSKPSLSYLPPIGAPAPKGNNKAGFLSFKLPSKKSKSPKVINFMEDEKENFFRFRDNSVEDSSQETRRIKPRQPQDPPPKPPQPPLKPPLPSSYERSSKEVVPFRPSEAFTEQQPVLSNEYGVPVRPPRPPKPKSIQVISSFYNIYLIIYLSKTI